MSKPERPSRTATQSLINRVTRYHLPPRTNGRRDPSELTPEQRRRGAQYQDEGPPHHSSPARITHVAYQRLEQDALVSGRTYVYPSSPTSTYLFLGEVHGRGVTPKHRKSNKQLTLAPLVVKNANALGTFAASTTSTTTTTTATTQASDATGGSKRKSTKESKVAKPANKEHKKKEEKKEKKEKKEKSASKKQKKPRTSSEDSSTTDSMPAVSPSKKRHSDTQSTTSSAANKRLCTPTTTGTLKRAYSPEPTAAKKHKTATATTGVSTTNINTNTSVTNSPGKRTRTTADLTIKKRKKINHRSGSQQPQLAGTKRGVNEEFVQYRESGVGRKRVREGYFQEGDPPIEYLTDDDADAEL